MLNEKQSALEHRKLAVMCGRIFHGAIIPLLMVLVLSSVVYAQTLKERLEQETDFTPSPAAPAEQLIQIAQQFQIPMAIEWVEPEHRPAKPVTEFSKGSVMEIIAAIVNHTPDHQLVVEDQMLYVFSPVVASHPFNFLNLCIESFNVQDESLFGAQAALRTSINMMLYPDLYRCGHNGGYGGGHPHSFWERNITFSGRNLTIREILTRIARANAVKPCG